MSDDTKKGAPSLSGKNAAEYLGNRVDAKVESYRRKGDRYRRLYLSMASLSVIGAASVPVLINLKDLPTIYATLVSLGVTIMVGLEGVFHFREHWKNYDLMKSFLRQEAAVFQAKGGAYREISEAEAFAVLVERVEEAILKERTQTIEMRTSQTKITDERAESGGKRIEPKRQ